MYGANLFVEQNVIMLAHTITDIQICEHFSCSNHDDFDTHYNSTGCLKHMYGANLFVEQNVIMLAHTITDIQICEHFSCSNHDDFDTHYNNTGCLKYMYGANLFVEQNVIMLAHNYPHLHTYSMLYTPVIHVLENG